MTFGECVSLLVLVLTTNALIVNDETPETRVYEVPTIQLSSSDDYVVKKFNFPARETSFCAYFKLNEYNTNQTLFTLKDNKNSSSIKIVSTDDSPRLRLQLTDGNVEVDVDYVSHREKFNKLCLLSMQANLTYWVWTNPMAEYFAGMKKVSFNVNDSTEMEFFVGDPDGDSPFSGTVGGLFITHGITENLENFFLYDFYKRDTATLFDQITFEDFKDWSTNISNSSIKDISFFNLSATEDDFLLLDGNLHKDPNATCKQFNGRNIGKDEIINYKECLLRSLEVSMEDTGDENSTLVWISKCRMFDWENGKTQTTCVAPHHAWTICILKAKTKFTFRLLTLNAAAGSMFDLVEGRQYFPSYKSNISKNDSIEYLNFRGKDSQIMFSDGKWILKFSNISDIWSCNETRLPLGKHTWYSKDEYIKQDLILSSCLTANSYLWSNFRDPRICNGRENCLDGSDELNCRIGNKIFYKGRFENGTLPSGVTQIDHDLGISSIGEVKFADRFLMVTLKIKLSWPDQRFFFRKGFGATTYNCSYLLWNPVIQIFSSCENENEIKLPIFLGKTTCLTEFGVEENKKGLSYPESNLREINDSIVHQKLLVQFELPCRFDFKLYPFAPQTCNFCIGIQNAKSSEYKLNPPNNSKYSYGSSGISNLGDFTLETFSSEVINTSKINLSIALSSPFNYYIVTGYLPSILILLVSYVTLYFRLDLFSERIGVSLTALLTMVFLFLETNSNVIKTSYIKYLDIWFLSTMTFSVGLVCFNSVLHYTFWKKEEMEDMKKMEALTNTEGSEEKSCLERETKFKIDMNGSQSSQRKLNRGGRIAFPLLFLLFCVAYVMGIVVKMQS